MTLYSGFDIFCYPIDITNNNNTIMFLYGIGNPTITIPPGTYYNYLGPSMGPGYPSLLAMIRDLMIAAVGYVGTFTFSYSAPSDGGRAQWGLSLTRSSGGGEWGFAGGTFDFSLLGGMGATTSSNTWKSPMSYGGVWRSPSPATRKLYNVQMEQYTNGGRGAVRQVTRWGEDQIRMFEYAMVPAALVRPGRALKDKYADLAGIALNDQSNIFLDFWRAGISSYRDILCIHDRGESGYSGVEILSSMAGSEYADSFESCIEQESINAEYYRVSFALRVIMSEYEQ